MYHHEEIQRLKAVNVHERIKLFIKLLFSNEKELYSFCAHLTGFCPRGIAIYRQALTHRPHHCQHDGRDSGTQRRSVGKHRRADAGHLCGDCDNTRRQTRGKENRSITTSFFIFPASRRHRRRGACGAVHCLKFSNFPGLWQKNRIKFLSKDIIY